MKKIIDLIRKTREKLIILDETGDPTAVVMSMKDYEKIMTERDEVINLTENELLDKINRDIVLWQEGNNLSQLTDNDGLLKNILSNQDSYLNLDKKQSGNKPLSGDEVDSEDEEDQYYFEPVE